MNLTDHVTKKAVQLIVDRAKKPSHLNNRAWRNLINTRLARAIKSGKIGQRDEKLCLDDLLRYARGKYGEECFKDFPQHGYDNPMDFPSITLIPPELMNLSMPFDVAACRVLLVEQAKEIRRLQEVIANLRPDAENWRIKICEKTGRTQQK